MRKLDAGLLHDRVPIPIFQTSHDEASAQKILVTSHYINSQRVNSDWFYKKKSFAQINSRDLKITGGIPLQNVVNSCCPLRRVPTMWGATTAKAKSTMQHFLTKLCRFWFARVVYLVLELLIALLASPHSHFHVCQEQPNKLLEITVYVYMLPNTVCENWTI